MFRKRIMTSWPRRTLSRLRHPLGVPIAPGGARRTRKLWCAWRKVVRRRRRALAAGDPQSYPDLGESFTFKGTSHGMDSSGQSGL